MNQNIASNRTEVLTYIGAHICGMASIRSMSTRALTLFTHFILIFRLTFNDCILLNNSLIQLTCMD